MSASRRILHGEVIASRLEKINKGDGVFLSLDEVKRRLGRG